MRFMNMPKNSVYRQSGKRIFDLIVTVPLLALISPLILLLGICSLCFLGRPVLFKQRRIGYREKPFILSKFRTMRYIHDRSGELLQDEARLVHYGRLLRASSLDELPTFWNVIKGDMSLVGPRPLLPEYLPRYTAVQRRRHDVRPGVTGWAQINGRNTLTWQQKFDLDVWYVDHWSLALDCKILWQTLLKVVRREGINQKGHATMPEFLGSAGPEPQVKVDDPQEKHSDFIRR
jgi:lipopolysaccharide/colanic/teichoic acid biosynthesis glycosyltransferase